MPYFRWWNFGRLISFHIALVIWLIALLKPVPLDLTAEVFADLQPIRAFMSKSTEGMDNLSGRLARFRRRLPWETDSRRD